MNMYTIMLQIAGLILTKQIVLHSVVSLLHVGKYNHVVLSYTTLKSMNLLHREANYKVLNGLWELLLHAIQSKDLFAESKHSITLKPQLIQVCKFYILSFF